MIHAAVYYKTQDIIIYGGKVWAHGGGGVVNIDIGPFNRKLTRCYYPVNHDNNMNDIVFNGDVAPINFVQLYIADDDSDDSVLPHAWVNDNCAFDVHEDDGLAPQNILDQYGLPY
jgi:hypothetical protein